MKVEVITLILPFKKMHNFAVVLIVLAVLLSCFIIFFKENKIKEDVDDDLGYLEHIVFEKGGFDE